MKLYTTFTPSHKVLYENYFLKTLPNEFELKVYKEPVQYCPSGNFYSEGWSETCYKKVEIFLRACKENMGKPFFYCDVDVQFFSDIKNILLEELGDKDIACQNDITTYSSGVFICRGNEKTLHMFETMLANFDKEDQTTLNNHIHLCNHKFLSGRFFTFGHIVPRPWYGPGDSFAAPKKMVVHHANWVVGVKKKMQIMDYVRSQYESE